MESDSFPQLENPLFRIITGLPTFSQLALKLTIFIYFGKIIMNGKAEALHEDISEMRRIQSIASRAARKSQAEVSSAGRRR
ncbi:hypothetical protein GCM10027172_22860 [Halomonas garicola]